MLEMGLLAILPMVAGWCVERWVLPLLKRSATRTRWRLDDILARALQGVPLVWGVLLGCTVLLNGLSMKESAHRVVQVVLLVVFVWTLCLAINRIITSLIDEQVRDAPQRRGGSTSIISNLVALIVYLLGGIMLLQHLGVSITPVLTALGVGGLAVALALQPTLSNLFSGLQLIASRQINNGDYVKLQSGEEGYVKDITWRNTILRSLSNNLVVVPNAQLAAAILSNFHLPDAEVAVGVDLGVAYDSDLEQVEQVTVDAARRVMRRLEPRLPTYEPSIRYNAFGPSAVQFSVGLRTTEYTGQYLLKHEFIKELHRVYAEHGIRIPYPIRTVRLEDHHSPEHDGTSPGDRRQSASLPDH